jgi:HK97 family phage major capsid protein
MQPGELIEILRNALIIRRLGARFLTGLRGPIGFAKQTGSAVAQWIVENGGVDAPETEAQTGLVTLSPKTLIGTTAFSRQLLTLGTYDAELMVRQDLAYSHAAALDLAAIHGTGGLQPTGIYNLAGVNAVAMGGNPTYAKLVDMITECAADNAILGALGFATNPRVAGKLMQTLEFAAAGAKATWTGKIDEGMVAGYAASCSNLVKANLGAGTNEHGLAAGCWDQMIVGQFGNGFEIITDPYAKKKQGLIEVTTFEMADLVVRHAESFCKATGVILS